jgi:hypothetical protein
MSVTIFLKWFFSAKGCQRRAIEAFKMKNYSTSLEWISIAVDKSKGANPDYLHLKAMVLMSLEQTDDANKILDVLIDQEHKPSIRSRQAIVFASATQFFLLGQFEECENELYVLIQPPFETDAETLHLLGMSQLRQRKFDLGWKNIETAANSGHEEAIRLMEKRKRNASENKTPKSSNSWLKKLGNSALAGAMQGMFHGAINSLIDGF